MDKRSLSERDICTKCITPALVQAGWDLQRQIREEVPLTDGRAKKQVSLTTSFRRAIKIYDWLAYGNKKTPPVPKD